MDYDNLSDEEAVELENTVEVRLLYNVLSQYKNGSCNRQAAVMAILRLLQPNISIIPTRGAPKQEDPLKRYEAIKVKIETGRQIEERIAVLRDEGSASPVNDAYAGFHREKTYLEESRNLWAEYGPDPYGYALEKWHAWRKMLRNNFKNIAEEAPVKFKNIRSHRIFKRTRNK